MVISEAICENQIQNPSACMESMGIYREIGIIKQDTGTKPVTDPLAVALGPWGERGSAFTIAGRRGVVVPAASDIGPYTNSFTVDMLRNKTELYNVQSSICLSVWALPCVCIYIYIYIYIDIPCSSTLKT